MPWAGPSKSATERPARSGSPASIGVTPACTSLSERAAPFATSRIARTALVQRGTRESPPSLWRVLPVAQRWHELGPPPLSARDSRELGNCRSFRGGPDGDRSRV